jgi:membrane fusion protein (multidrug efflux system)
MQKHWLLIAFIFSFVTLSCYAKGDGSAGKQMPPPAVSAAIVTTQPWQQSIQLTGSLAALQGIMVKPQISGQISQINFKSGQDVQKGQPLIVLNQDQLTAQLQLQQSNLTLKEEEFRRSKELFQKHAIAQADFQTAQSDLSSAKAQVAAAKAQLNEASTSAPFSGRLGLRLVSLGDYVPAGQNIVNLQQLDPIVANFNIPETYINKVKVGDAVQIKSDAFPNQFFQGNVYAMDSAIDPNSRTLAARAKIPNPEKKLLPGGFVEVTLFIGPKTPVIIIPQTALDSEFDGTYVYRIINNKAVKTKVVVTHRGDQNAVITSGLKAGDKIIIAGQMKITADNSPVVVEQGKK